MGQIEDGVEPLTPRAQFARRALSALSLLLMPVLVVQGLVVRRTTPRLPGASGPDRGETRAGRPATDARLPAAPVLHLLLVGESTTAGVGAPTHEAGLAGGIARALGALTGRDVRWRALGRGGACARVVRTQLLVPAEIDAADIAVIALGVNDTLQWTRSARWRSEVKRLVAAVRERCGEIPIVLSAVPPVGRFPALPQPLRAVLGLRARILDAALAELAADELARARHVPMPRFADGGAGVEPWFCADRFHPSPRGYAAWGAALAQAAHGLLGASARKSISP
jgi:lysophospholipase L1-like esterase